MTLSYMEIAWTFLEKQIVNLYMKGQVLTVFDCFSMLVKIEILVGKWDFRSIVTCT